MYDYRTWTPEQQAAAIEERKTRGYPWHGPPHMELPDQFRIVTAACFEHRSVLSNTTRLASFEKELLAYLNALAVPCAAWVVLPNHYHVLVRIADIKTFARDLGKLHGRASHEWNQQDGEAGRRVWYRSQDRCMRSERHYYTSLNYIHSNPVKHGYVKKWTDWPYSSVHWYLEHKGRDWMLDLWRSHPVLNYGDTWDLFVVPPSGGKEPPEGGTAN